MTACDHYPKTFPCLGGRVLVACLSAAGCLGFDGWCGYGRYGLFSLHVPYLIVLTNKNQALVTPINLFYSIP